MTVRLDTIDTPAILLDRAVLEHNIAAAADRAAAHGLQLRPHVKSHKSVAIAKIQIAAGACGITVAKSSEAEVFIRGGIRDITVAYPLIDPAKIARLLTVAKEHGTKLNLIVDSAFGVDAIGSVARDIAFETQVMVKIDVGLHRCGVDPAGDGAVALARMIADRPQLTFGGIISHAGHAYSASDRDGVAAIAREEQTIMRDVADKIAAAGLQVPCISVGSTPTVWACYHYENTTEIRPGNYVFMDLTQASLGLITRADIALTVLATVVSCNDTYAIIDAGSKVLSSDRGPHGSARLSGFGLAVPAGSDHPGMPVISLSEEHGFVAHGGRRPAIGERLRIYPNHACPVVNLARTFQVLNEEGSLELWPIDAHGTVF
jgi:D-serine deaminase-like pyridoxal phosphate-dependent protein